MPTIYGDLVDQMTRCTDYSKDTDIIALKCFSCRKYYLVIVAIIGMKTIFLKPILNIWRRIR